MSLAQGTTITSAQSGNWATASTWAGGVVPTTGKAVVINAGHTVVYNQSSDAVLGKITVKGKLSFSRAANTRLKVGNNVVVYPDGYLDMGTITDSITANAELTFVLTPTQADAYQGAPDSMVHDADSALTTTDIGLWVFGRWDSHGAPLTRTWSKLATDASTGTATLAVVNNISDWPVGGEVIVTSTRNPLAYYINNGQEKSYRYVEHEQRTIAAVSGNVITFTQPLSYTHSGVAPFAGEIGLLTRNVVVKTELVGVNPATYTTDVRTRKFAHTAYQVGASGDLQYTEFYRLGHYGKNGRYMLHYHRMLETSIGMVARGNAMHETGFRCVNLHIAHGVIVEDNVCYDSQSAAYYSELDEFATNYIPGYVRGYNEDNIFVHNLSVGTRAKHFDDRANFAIAGEYNRSADFWPGAQTQHEVYLGNVAAGGYEFVDGGGYTFHEIGNDIKSSGTIPFTFVHNEAHSSATHGLFTWQNTTIPRRDVVDTLLWRNGNAGLRWGAYLMPFSIFNSRFLQNGKVGVDITSNNIFLQDNEIVGSTDDNSLSDIGIYFRGYVNPQYPNPPVWLARNHLDDLPTAGITQVQKPTPNHNVNGDECSTHDFPLNTPYDLRLRPVIGGECSGIYITMLGNTFGDVPNELVYGDALNPNSFWKVYDHNGNDFVILRQDQANSVDRGVIPQQLFTTTAVHSSSIDALLVPMSSLPYAGIAFTGLFNHRTQADQSKSPSPDFTFTTQADYPPVVALATTLSNGVATIAASATDDHGVTRLEIFVDWIKVASVPTPSHTITVDLSQHPLRYAYIYARAFDGTQQIVNYEQRAYSNVIELGPEELQAAPPVVATLQPNATAGIDTVLNETLPGNNYGASTTLWAGTSTLLTQRTRSLLKFDLSAIPANATIISATVTLYASAQDSATDYAVGFHKALVTWAENTATWAATSGTAGTDYAVNASDSVLITNLNQTYTWDVTADVAAFVATPANNLGWYLVSPLETTIRTRKLFSSSDAANAADRPLLTVVYTSE